MGPSSLPWTNCRIVLAEELNDDDYTPGKRGLSVRRAAPLALLGGPTGPQRHWGPQRRGAGRAGGTAVLSTAAAWAPTVPPRPGSFRTTVPHSAGALYNDFVSLDQCELLWAVLFSLQEW